MTERDRGAGSGGTKDNVRDDLEEATRRGRPERDVPAEASEEEADGTGGVKDNITDEQEETQERS
ncbi:MAG: hypothetical protein M3341_03280 [Actinomycetota bacterium]|jgi:hypothetical protein|nr:hypothetical protein [Actinomycetota bacterium]